MTLHTKLSYLKSGLRIIGYLLLGFISPAVGMLLIIAEVIGILEELPGSYKGTDTTTKEST